MGKERVIWDVWTNELRRRTGGGCHSAAEAPREMCGRVTELILRRAQEDGLGKSALFGMRGSTSSAAGTAAANGASRDCN